MARLTNRVLKLEQSKGAGEKRLIIPHCCFYGECANGCVPYLTTAPMVIKKGMVDFYREANECQPMPKGVEAAEWNGLGGTA